MDLPIYWTSNTHVGTIRRLFGTTADGRKHDLGPWSCDTTERKTGRGESAIPYDSVEATVTRLTEKYDGFHVVTEPDLVAFLVEAER